MPATNASAPGIGLVTVAFSSGDGLRTLVESVPAASACPVSIVVSDNGSDDGSLESIVGRPDVTVVHNGANLGYGAAVNAGVRALPATIELVLIVNPDVVLGEHALDELIAALDRHPDAGAVGPLITTSDGVIYPSARQLPSVGSGVGHAVLGWCWPNNPWTRAYRLDHAAPQERDAGWLSGSCLLVRRSAFEQVGGFDPAYFMYFEDVDLGDRLAKAGWHNVYVPSATVMHVGGVSTRPHRPAMIKAHHRSAYRYLAGRYPRWWQAPLRLVLRAGLAARSALAGRSERVAEGAGLPAGPVDG